MPIWTTTTPHSLLDTKQDSVGRLYRLRPNMLCKMYSLAEILYKINNTNESDKSNLVDQLKHIN